MSSKIIKKEIEFLGKKLSFEYGEVAMMATMAVKAQYGDTVVLVTAVEVPGNEDKDFAQISISYEEKLYASGMIKNSRFVKRDGRATDDAIVTRRLIDHAVRPLFPNNYPDEVQIVVTVLSLDEASDAELLGMLAVSACLHASTIPWQGPMVTARVGYVDDNYVMNLGKEELEEKSQLDMMISFAGKELKFLAVEAEADILPEEKILGAIEYARNHLEDVYKLIEDFAKAVNPKSEKRAFVPRILDPELVKEVDGIAKADIVDAMSQNLDKVAMTEKFKELFDACYLKLEGKYKKTDITKALDEIKKHALQHLILEQNRRPDGRGIKDIRPISSSVGILPRTHGSALFTRGITQALTVATLGSPSLELLIQNMYGDKTKRYMHYYNYPPYASGETGRLGGPGGREIGHGMLAEKALRPVVPSQKEFPYTIILMSEILSSSGSSSMAATCGSTLALMDAGVPIKDMVAGVGVGLIVNDDLSKQLIMTDLAYMEDAFGFLDFKMTGTRQGVTAMQADMKLPGIPMSLLPKIFEQSKEGRMHVLDQMAQTIQEPRAAVSVYAPKSFTTKIDPEKIGMVIGSGGKTIKEIQEKTGAEINIDEDGTVTVSAVNADHAKKALEWIEGIVKEVKAGEIYDGVVQDIVDFGAFVEILPGKDGLLHVSELANQYVANVTDILNVGDTVKVKVLEVGRDGKISLSKKALEPGASEEPRAPRRDADRGRGGFRGNDRGGRRPGRF